MLSKNVQMCCFALKSGSGSYYKKLKFNMILRLMEALFGLDMRQPEQEPSLKTDMPLKINEMNIVPLQYRDDVENLKSYVGEDNWKAGLEITITLQELLTICPRQRKRSDSYRKLIAYLDEELKIKITIKKKEKR